MTGSTLLDRVTLGDHVCWVVDDDRVRLDAIAAFARAGLRARQKVVYDGDDPEAVLAGIAGRGVATRQALRSGQLRAQWPEASYLAGGSFDPEATIDLWRTGIAEAREEGWVGLRVIGDMSWVRRGVPGAEHLPWYEANINGLFAEGFVAGVCAYDRRLFDPIELRRLTWAHPGAAASGLPYDPRRSLRIRRTHAPPGLSLSGEADLSNRTALATVIDRLAARGDGELTIDVSGLRFADTAATRILVTAAASGPRRIRLVGCSPALRRLLDFHGAGGVPQLTVESR